MPGSVQRPDYERDRLAHGIVHIGVGGFHRAHQAVYLDDLLRSGQGGGWSICGVCLLPQDEKMYRAMESQDCLFTVLELSGAGIQARVIGSITEILFAPENPEAVIEKMASPACRIVSLTITEGGYYVNERTGGFDSGHPEIVHDLAHPDNPQCSFGYLAAALERRRLRGLAPFSLQSCDNLQGNGDVLRESFLGFAGLYNPALAEWLAKNGSFPNSMVDRITPATTDEQRSMLREQFGVEDSWPVVTEPFRQWVIEDTFPSGRPAWEKAGALMTRDVLPYEKMKIRLLNASHQALSHIGLLVGHQYVDQAIADPRIRRLVAIMMEAEASPTLEAVPGVDLVAYKKEVIARFANPAIRDQLARISMDASARIPKFVLPIVVDQLAGHGDFRACAFTLAAWFRTLAGSDDLGRPLPVADAMAGRLVPLARAAGPDAKALLSVREIFGDEVSKSLDFEGLVSRMLRSFYEQGANATLERFLAEGDF